MSDVAHALGMDQAEIRRRNFVPPEAFPYTNAGNITYDSGNYAGALERVLALIDYENLTREIASVARRAKSSASVSPAVSRSRGWLGKWRRHPEGRRSRCTLSPVHRRTARGWRLRSPRSSPTN